jgi:hypothetical protein
VSARNTAFAAIAVGRYHSVAIKGYPRGDLDRDRDIDVVDFEFLPNCPFGRDFPLPPECDADLGDLASFQAPFTGPR